MTARLITRDGGCLCGAVRFRAAGEPLRLNHCHCSMCRKAGGAAVATWATYPRRAVIYLAAGPRFRRSSEHAERGFCPKCGSAMAWRSERDAEEIDLTVGTFDDPGSLPAPRDHLWFQHAIAWLRIDDHIPHYPRSRGSAD